MARNPDFPTEEFLIVSQMGDPLLPGSRAGLKGFYLCGLLRLLAEWQLFSLLAYSSTGHIQGLGLRNSKCTEVNDAKAPYMMGLFSL